MNTLFSATFDNLNPSKLDKRLVESALFIPQTQLHCDFDVYILCDEQRLLSCSEILSRWSDGSVKWLKITFVKSGLEANYAQDKPIHCIIYAATNFENRKNHASETRDDSLSSVALITKNNSIDFTIALAREKIACHWRLADENNNELNTHEVKHESSLQLADDGSIFASRIMTTAIFTNSSGASVKFHAYYKIFNHLALLDVSTSLHNPQRADHVDGKWDLGDKQSFNFSAFDFEAHFSLLEKTYVTNDSQPKLTLGKDDSYHICQHASGGENWNSPIHADADNKIPMLCNGYIVTINQKEHHVVGRASPIVDVKYQGLNCQIFCKNFWQTFPTALQIKNQKVLLCFFPKVNYLHELQGGEKSTHEFNFNFSKQAIACTSRIVIVDRQQQILKSFSYPSKNFNQIIHQALQGNNSFFAKREKIDQYGWRNFGDLYADHETAYYAGDDLFVSHYNNQYDPIFGFLKQYLISGDNKWFELADDLAKHVKDIDMYHTTEDKAEYNGGLFWHTDHYLPAFTSTHRSYSKHQDSNAYQDHAGGGGPGGQHCYTTGLMLHYLLTGNETSKQAVLTLSAWITCVYEGTNTCLELILALKNRHVAGAKNHFTGQYPLDRGTANYIIALLDSFELTQERAYLTRVEHIISHTVHPNEDVKLRNLKDVENTWFYTVFLQAVCRYLLVKQQLDELDTNFYYSRDCLLNFASWMAKHEYMYLDKPDILEYPNDTWTAQDLRKATVFAAAYYFSPQQEQIYLDKAEYFENQVSTRLNTSKTETYTRIMVLVLQNCGQVDFYKNLPKPADLKLYQDNWPAPRYGNRGLLSSFVTNMAKRLCRLSLKNEINWLKKRLS